MSAKCQKQTSIDPPWPRMSASRKGIHTGRSEIPKAPEKRRIVANCTLPAIGTRTMTPLTLRLPVSSNGLGGTGGVTLWYMCRARKHHPKERRMAMLKVIEVLEESNKSWEDAAQKAVTRANESVRNVRSIYIKNMEATVENGKIKTYRINGKVSFVLEG